jgi:peptidylprolyl isomerase
MHNRILSLVAVAAVVLVGGCQNPVGEDKLPPPDPTQVVYASSLNINLSQFTRLESGVYIQDVTVGSGATIASGDSVAVGYTGWLVNGTQFDTNQGSGTPFRFKVGAKQVIDGWEVGVVGMRVGGTRRLIIPSTLAYGRSGSPPSIPSNAVLVFSVTMAQKF